MDNWYSRHRFVPGDVYVDADGLHALQYVGIVSARSALRLMADEEHQIDCDHDSESVVLFRVFDDKVDTAVTFYTHTRSDADRGYAFVVLADMVDNGAISTADLASRPTAC
ncbi:MAG: hypothetical protein ABI949_09545 [Ilumatobacteraceae bacterium]